jgi:hypothetical protein
LGSEKGHDQIKSQRENAIISRYLDQSYGLRNQARTQDLLKINIITDLIHFFFIVKVR